MTVLEWLRNTTRYSFSDPQLSNIALNREISPEEDVFGGSVTKRDRELMTADIIFTAILLSPSSTASLTQSHNGYQKVVGSETDYYQDDKIKYAIGIYKRYDDERAEILENMQKKIRFVPIKDVDRL